MKRALIISQLYYIISTSFEWHLSLCILHNIIIFLLLLGKKHSLLFFFLFLVVWELINDRWFPNWYLIEWQLFILIPLCKRWLHKVEVGTGGTYNSFAVSLAASEELPFQVHAITLPNWVNEIWGANIVAERHLSPNNLLSGERNIPVATPVSLCEMTINIFY